MSKIRLGFILCAVLGLALTSDAQNIINHNANVVQTITGLRAKGLDIRVLPTPQIIAYFVDTAGKEEAFSYPCAPNACADDTDAEVTTLINSLNTANLTSNSLLRRVSVKVCADFPTRFPNGCTVP